MNLVRNATSNAFISIGDVEINIILANQSAFDRKELNMGNNSAVIVESLDIPSNNTNSYYAVVLAKLTIQKPYQQTEGKDLNGISQSLLSIPCSTSSTYLLIDVFDKSKNREVTASVAYTITCSPNTSTAVQELIIPQNAFTGRRVVKDIEYTCLFYDDSKLTFSSAGCSVDSFSSGSGSVTCSCNHTTVFAALLSVNNFEVPAEVRVGSTFFEFVA